MSNKSGKWLSLVLGIVLFLEGVLYGLNLYDVNRLTVTILILCISAFSFISYLEIKKVKKDDDDE